MNSELRTTEDLNARRIERWVGMFIVVAILLLMAGFGYYLYHTAQRKGWLVPHAPYFTFVYSGEGLNVGDPVTLMGFNRRVARTASMSHLKSADRTTATFCQTRTLMSQRRGCLAAGGWKSHRGSMGCRRFTRKTE